MRLIIDMQGAQTASRFRGIGRYTLALVTEMAKQRGEHDMLLVLNAAYPDSIEPIRTAFAALLPLDAIRVFEVAGPVGGHDAANDARRKAAEQMLDAFMASLEPDVIFIPSLFEEFGGEAITSVHSLHHAIPTVVVLYDLIPLIHHHIYLKPNAAMERWYLEKINHLRRAELLLSISESSGQEAKQHLNFPEQTVVNISTACDDDFHPIALGAAQRAHLKNTYGISRPFVMNTGGTDQRKNIDGLFRAFANLPAEVREAYVLALVGREVAEQKAHFLNLAMDVGLREDELVFTGYVSDQDLALLYNACELLVFPSWHEGFGLPVLEAMACGKAVIAANSSSLPEVVGRADALFAPRDDAAMSAKMAEVLGKPEFRQELERHGLEQAQKFSWTVSAQRAWQALEKLNQEHQQPKITLPLPQRPRLAFVSPLPPEKTGIADYAAELLPELARHYDITVIVEQADVTDAWSSANTPIRNADWFRQHAQQFDRVVYQFGNSERHVYMFDLLAEIPGLVVLHDFYLSGVLAWVMEEEATHRFSWTKALHAAHGWNAVKERFTEKDIEKLIWKYPCNLNVVQQALGIIVHTEDSRKLARQFYGAEAATEWAVIPYPRQPIINLDKALSRKQLGIAVNDFVLCSFGALGENQMSQRVLEAWIASPLAQKPYSYLVFAGEKAIGTFGEAFLNARIQSPAKNRIIITGHLTPDMYSAWLTAADAAVQLQAISRGEASNAALDCMNYGLPTIVNANGSIADLPADAVWLMSDKFTDQELIEALNHLYEDAAHREELGQRARTHIRMHHNPRSSVDQYSEAVETTYRKASYALLGLIQNLPRLVPALSTTELFDYANSLSINFPPKIRKPQLLLDISELVQRDAKTGIQRVTRSLLLEIICSASREFLVEPVYAGIDFPGYRYARKFMSSFFGLDNDCFEDRPVEAWQNDIFLGLDLQSHIVVAQRETLQSWHIRGVKCFFIIYDLLPVTIPDVFPEGARDGHQHWLQTISLFDGALCISRAVADEMVDWLQAFGEYRERPFALHWFHLGADIDNSATSLGMPADASHTLANLKTRPTFLMVGTIEPRKGYLQTIQAFDTLWAQGVDVNLAVVGKEGWKPLPNDLRRDIPQTVSTLRNHPEVDKRLFWLEGISDEYLEQVYAHANCLIAASYDEGFGLPLIEAARHGLPLIARDIPVFREVTDGHAFVFHDSRDPQAIADAVQAWLALFKQGKHPLSTAMPYQTWRYSAKQILDVLFNNTSPYKTWLPDGARRYRGADPRLQTEVGQRVGKIIQTTSNAGMLVYGPYERIEAGTYLATIDGNFSSLTGEEWLDVVCNKGRQLIECRQFIINCARDSKIIMGFEVCNPCDDFELRIFVDHESIIDIFNITITKNLCPSTTVKLLVTEKKADYLFDFSIVNKSYHKDLEWSIALYRSWLKFSAVNIPYFIVVPESDLPLFCARLTELLQTGKLIVSPILLSEEDVFNTAKIDIPQKFTGWHIQQAVKLYFSKTKLSRDYVTLDSAMFFARDFDYKWFYSSGGSLRTAARPVIKSEIFSHMDSINEKGFLHGSLVVLSQSLNYICDFFDNDTLTTHWYIAGIGLFQSDILEELDLYSKSKNINGMIGLLEIAPYEFAWYGEYVFIKHPERFFPKEPLFMVPIIDLDSIDVSYDHNHAFEEDKFGYLFQPPASDEVSIQHLIENHLIDINK